ncbi:MAG: ATP-binding cassette domain-containing protein [Lachnospiraceae bacterium]|nr:ATP-binding cassette domain-containing protein [Lachnospiraceae bacterium]
MQQHIRKAGIILFWLLVWQMAAVMVDNSLILVGPVETVAALVSRMGEFTFWQTVAGSTARIFCGFLLAFAVGFFMGALASKVPLVKDLLEPLVTLMRTVPVASLVILTLILVGVEGLTLTISFLVVFPIIYQSTLTGFSAVDRTLVEMAQVFHLPLWKRFLYIYRPALWPVLIGGCKTALGMSWKSGVAAEVIGTPNFSIGAELYMAKIYFDTAELFGWTLVIILLSVCFEHVFLWIMRQLGQPFGGLLKKNNVKQGPGVSVEVSNLSKSYGEQVVLDQLTLRFEPGSVIGMMAPSGAGKTTLFRLLMGLEQADAGHILTADVAVIAAAFQEDRLCADLTAQENAQIAGGESDLVRILPAEALQKKASELSGGMKRRVAVARAMASPGQIVLLDEPFSGLDEVTKERVMDYILEKRKGRTLIFTTHDVQDIKKMQAALFELPAHSI